MINGKEYCITPKNVGAHELIGLDVVVKESTDVGRNEVSGKILNETKNTFIIKNNDTKKIVPKKECKFEFNLDGEKIILDGKKLNYRPEDRIKNWRN